MTEAHALAAQAHRYTREADRIYAATIGVEHQPTRDALFRQAFRQDEIGNALWSRAARIWTRQERCP